MHILLFFKIPESLVVRSLLGVLSGLVGVNLVDKLSLLSGLVEEVLGGVVLVGNQKGARDDEHPSAGAQLGRGGGVDGPALLLLLQGEGGGDKRRRRRGGNAASSETSKHFVVVVVVECDT